MRNTHPTHLFFDLDGTLTDPQEGICACIVSALSQLNTPAPPHAELMTFIGQPLEDIFSRLLTTQDSVILTKAIALYRDRFSTIGLFENRIYDGIPAALEALHQSKQYTLHLVTAKPTLFAKRILEYFDLDKYFTGIYGSELDGSLVHKQDIIAHALASEKLQPKQALMIGDRDMDIQGAHAHHLKAMAVTWGFGTLAELTPTAPDLWAHTPEEIPSSLKGYSTS